MTHRRHSLLETDSILRCQFLCLLSAVSIVNIHSLFFMQFLSFWYRLNKKMSKTRTNSGVILRHGFVHPGEEDWDKWVVRHKVLTNENPQAIKTISISPELWKSSKWVSGLFSAQGCDTYKYPVRFIWKSSPKPKAAIEASFLVTYKVGEQQKFHPNAENLTMPCAYEMVSNVCGEDQAMKLSVISLSNNTIHQWVHDIVSNTLSQVTI